MFMVVTVRIISHVCAKRASASAAFRGENCVTPRFAPKRKIDALLLADLHQRVAIEQDGLWQFKG